MSSESRVAGIDVHKRMLAVVVSSQVGEGECVERRMFGTTRQELRHLSAWLEGQGVEEVVMESTAQYWRPVWLALQGQCRLHLAQAQSNRARRGRKSDYRDAERLVRRLLAGELVLSFVPEGEQREWRILTRTKYQRVRERIRLQSQVENLLEEMQIKLSSVVSDVFGVSSRRILQALVEAKSVEEMVALGHYRLRASQEVLRDALDGRPNPCQRNVLELHLKHLARIEEQIDKLERMAAEAMQEHAAAIARLAKVPGIGVSAAQQFLAELGPRAAAFPSAAQLASWVGVCPGQNESAGKSRSEHSAKGNSTMRRLLAEVAHAAVHCRGCRMEVIFRRLYRGWAMQKPSGRSPTGSVL
jgi:transposase